MSKAEIEPLNVESSWETIEGTFWGNEITLAIDNPWAGDSVSGFGRTCTINISREQARKIAQWLLQVSEATEPTP